MPRGLWQSCHFWGDFDQCHFWAMGIMIEGILIYIQLLYMYTYRNDEEWSQKLTSNTRRSGELNETDVKIWKLTKCSYISSAITGTLYVSQICRTSFMCCLENTLPQGLEGLLMMIAAVWSSIRDSMWFRSISHDFSGCNYTYI